MKTNENKNMTLDENIKVEQNDNMKGDENVDRI